MIKSSMPVKKVSSKSKIHLARYAEIIKVLIKYGFDDIASSLRKKENSTISKMLLSKDKEGTIKEISRWRRIRMMLEELGTTFIKLGQMLSGRPDLVPEELIEELERLQDLTPTFEGSLAVQIIEENLGRPLGEMFKSFDSTPLASASIGQVHRAALQDGTEVIIKVQRPDIHNQIEVDMDILRALAKYAEKYKEEFKYYNPTAIVEALERTLELELDYQHETSNILRFRQNRDNGQTDIIVPEVYAEYSSNRVLTMGFIEGFKINNLKAYVLNDISPKDVAKKVMNSFFQQVFVDGFFHADPHPGNVFVNKEGGLCFLDYGMMGQVPERDKELLGDLFIAIEIRDSDRILESLKALSRIDFVEDEIGLQGEIETLLNNYYSADLKDIHLTELLEKFRGIILKYRLQIPADFFLLFKALSSMENNVRVLYPDVPLLDYLRPYARKLIMKKLNPYRRLKALYLTLYDFAELLQNFPGDVRKIMGKLKHGSLKVEIEHIGLSELRVSLEEISNRISLSILIAAMIIGSSLIVNAKIPPFINGIPILGLIGFIVAVILAGWLIISILRSGKQ
ncbi:MAG: AarF/ABC1/UbiB kinase family protein [Anditalea sp.]